MPNKQKHISQYKKNKSLANSNFMKKTENKDWRIVMIFYATMHCLDSSYADKFHPETHTTRKNFLERTSEYDDIIDEYQNLEMLSRKCRYDCVNIMDKEVTDALINMKAVEDFVGKISV